MLQSMYLVFGSFSFIFFLAALFHKRKAIRFTLMLVSLIMFGALSIGSLGITIKECQVVSTLSNSTNVSYSSSNNTLTTFNNDILCEDVNHYDVALAWVFGGFAIIAGVLLFIMGMTFASPKEDDF